ncbi:hypothetical protein [Brevibacillus borstelensis]|jgi:hypothetical protein|uniref:hypothetical protein n=1 Tax=Brevibacillus borstelensis TaxID=45462 RepID=UPI000469B140|nr:hypothetical protein [Brevibacillus borstelensis]
MDLALIITFFQEWSPLIVLLLFVAGLMLADLYPKVLLFITEVEKAFPDVYMRLEYREQALVDCYERLPARIRAGFAIIGGKTAWAALIKTMYRYIRRKSMKR